MHDERTEGPAVTTPTSTDSTDSTVTPTRRGWLRREYRRLRYEYEAVLPAVALAIGILIGLWAGTLIANNQRDGCTQLGAVWVATASGTRCVPAGSFTSFLLNMTR